MLLWWPLRNGVATGGKMPTSQPHSHRRFLDPPFAWPPLRHLPCGGGERGAHLNTHKHMRHSQGP